MRDWIASVAAHAELSASDGAVTRAREDAARGDESWAEWIDDLEAGRALTVQLVVSVVCQREDGTTERASMQNRDVWVERHVDPPKVAEQVREVAAKDFDALAAELRRRGIDVDSRDLDHMYVEVTLGASLSAELTRPPPSPRPVETSRGPTAG